MFVFVLFLLFVVVWFFSIQFCGGDVYMIAFRTLSQYGLLLLWMLAVVTGIMFNVLPLGFMACVVRCCWALPFVVDVHCLARVVRAVVVGGMRWVWHVDGWSFRYYSFVFCLVLFLKFVFYICPLADCCYRRYSC